MHRRFRNSPVPLEPSTGPIRIAPSLRRKLDAFKMEKDGVANANDDNPRLRLIVFGETDNSMFLQHKVKVAMGRGLIRTQAELQAIHARILEEMSNETAVRVESIQKGIENVEGQILHTLNHSPVVVANLPIERIEQLLKGHPEIGYVAEDVRRERISFPTRQMAPRIGRTGGELGDDQAADHRRRRLKCDGLDRNHIHHFDKFYPDFNGASTFYGKVEGVPLGVAEAPSSHRDSAVDNEHVGFRSKANGPFRLAPPLGRLYNCIDADCKEVDDFEEADESEHATSVTGIIAGDTMDDQALDEYNRDDSVDTPDWKKAHTGVCPKCRITHYRTDGLDSSLASVLDATLACDEKHGHCPNIINFSAGALEDGCEGTGLGSRIGNSFFTAGKLLVTASGNSRHQVPVDKCSAVSPASAHAVLTVGSLGETGEIGEDGPCQGAEVAHFSSQGDFETDRTIVDVVAQGVYTSMLDAEGTFTAKGVGTSFAAPVVTGFLGVFSHWYLGSGIGTDVNDPGILMVATLLQTDFMSEQGRITHGFDRLWGGGVLKAQRFDDEHVAYPGGAAFGTVCIGEGDEVDIEVEEDNSGAFSLSAVLFWFDRRAERGLPWANVDLELNSKNGRCESKALLDNKERCRMKVKKRNSSIIRILGVRIPGTDAHCGKHKQLVYYAYSYQSDGSATKVQEGTVRG
ncbi:unnamed protein product [Vitrella brassicaformis CCMP3155]|uniref:subtilisin n=1 Tax=Vitrella brassicaformis (strain CCMP3155) TaxID=1169540 RepID=A0A0G4H099_VITBC|nr:unnamed protein product [Vitrella brassicaformis CCMP3155]|eukprot:CEM36707.1 unnamed protein product [Vitrella brassicaformis CCMP3155]